MDDIVDVADTSPDRGLDIVRAIVEVVGHRVASHDRQFGIGIDKDAEARIFFGRFRLVVGTARAIVLPVGSTRHIGQAPAVDIADAGIAAFVIIIDIDVNVIVVLLLLKERVAARRQGYCREGEEAEETDILILHNCFRISYRYFGLEAQTKTKGPLAKIRIGAVAACHLVGEVVGIGIVERNDVLARHIDTDTIDTHLLDPTIGK